MKQIPFNKSTFNFHHIVGDAFGTYALEYLHNMAEKEYKELFKVGADSITNLHDTFYDRYRAGWPELEIMYAFFIKDVIAPLYPESFLYQKFPTFRVHLPNNLAVGDFHTDAEFNHPEGEINYIIPLTNSEGNASVWVESYAGKNDFTAIKLEVGSLVKFNGNKLRHGNRVNDTGKTRVSMDFRVLPYSDYLRNGSHDAYWEKGSVTRGTKFIIGDYYKLFENK